MTDIRPSLGGIERRLSEAFHNMTVRHRTLAWHCEREHACRCECRIAVAGCDVEHGRAAAQVRSFTPLLADELQRRSDDGEIAAAPGELLPRLDPAEVDRGIKARCG